MAQVASAHQYQCDLTALNADQRKRRSELAGATLPQSLEVKELTTGYEFRFNFSPSLFRDIAEMSTLEHLCCPFLQITLEIEKNNGIVRLRLTGDSGVKQFIEAELKP